MDLIVGKPYFVVLFKDEGLSIPVVKTLIFEKTFMRGEVLSCLFKTIPFEDSEEADFFVDAEYASHLVLDMSGLVERLKNPFR